MKVYKGHAVIQHFATTGEEWSVSRSASLDQEKQCMALKEYETELAPEVVRTFWTEENSLSRLELHPCCPASSQSLF
jgi:hypothetical protein